MRARIWSDRLRSGDGQVVVATTGAQVEGFCWFGPASDEGDRPGTVGQVRSIHVSPEPSDKRCSSSPSRGASSATRDEAPSSPPRRTSWPLQLRSFTEEWQARGRTPSSTLIDARTEPAEDEVAAALEIAPETPVFRFERLRSADATPMAYEVVYLEAARFQGSTRS